MRKLLFLASLVLSACAGAQVSSPVSAGDHKAASRASTSSELAADREEHGPVAYHRCGDSVLSDQATSGGERLTQDSPCWEVNQARVEAQSQRFDDYSGARRGAETLPSCNDLTTDQLAQGQSCTQGIMVR
jgi:hypothetical protein